MPSMGSIQLRCPATPLSQVAYDQGEHSQKAKLTQEDTALRLASGEGEEGGHTNMPVASRELRITGCMSSRIWLPRSLAKYLKSQGMYSTDSPSPACAPASMLRIFHHHTR